MQSNPLLHSVHVHVYVYPSWHVFARKKGIAVTYGMSLVSLVVYGTLNKTIKRFKLQSAKRNASWGL